MNSRKIALGLMTLSFVMIMSGGVSSFVLGLKKDHEETQKRIVTVNNEFEVLSTNTSIFEELRDDLYNKALGNVYYDTMHKEDKNIKERLSNYENLVDEMEKTVSKLDELCDKVYYPDIETNTKCNNYKSIFEQVNNYFVSDIKLYNKNVKKYNKYQKDKNSNLLISKYIIKRNYIDFNGDNKFDGKEE